MPDIPGKRWLTPEEAGAMKREAVEVLVIFGLALAVLHGCTTHDTTSICQVQCAVGYVAGPTGCECVPIDAGADAAAEGGR